MCMGVGWEQSYKGVRANIVVRIMATGKMAFFFQAVKPYWQDC